MKSVLCRVLLVALVAFGCTDAKDPRRERANVAAPESPTEPAPAEVEPPPPQFVVTFNAGLARKFVPHVEARLPAVIEAVAKIDADAVCLQEVWADGDVDAVKAGVKERFPHAFHVATAGEASGGPACTAGALKPLGDCVGGPCKGQEDITGCVMKTCPIAFLGLPGGCRTCLAANLSKPMDEVLASCTSAGGASLAYDGRNGLLLLSKHPLTETSHLVLDSFLLRRVVLHARFRVIGGDVDLFCTHLTAPLAEVEYQGSFSTWDGEQAHQIDQVIAWVDEVAAGESAILMGDMNCGPANTEWEVTASAPDNFQRFLAAGFRSPYTENHGHCTWCGKANPLIRNSPDLHILDHVLFRRFADELLLPERALDDMRVKTESGKVPLSDHYGIRVSFEVPLVKE